MTCLPLASCSGAELWVPFVAAAHVVVVARSSATSSLLAVVPSPPSCDDTGPDEGMDPVWGCAVVLRAYAVEPPKPATAAATSATVTTCLSLSPQSSAVT